MNHSPSRNSLLQRLLQASPTCAARLERVHLTPGPWLAERDHVYFPEEGLVALSSASASALPSVLGRHACWLNPQEDAAAWGLQAHVLEAGQAQRLRWSDLVQAPEQVGHWLLQTAAASQLLVQQTAQLAYCTQHHAPVQQLASWLLICLDQADTPALKIHASLALQGLGVSGDEGHAHLLALQAQGALVLGGGDAAAGAQPMLQQLQAAQLATLACSCHRQVALNKGPRKLLARGLC